eukprot:scaffold6388_cov66-Phaeocystis_antarctica.AAC.2
MLQAQLVGGRPSGQPQRQLGDARGRLGELQVARSLDVVHPRERGRREPGDVLLQVRVQRWKRHCFVRRCLQALDDHVRLGEALIAVVRQRRTPPAPILGQPVTGCLALAHSALAVVWGPRVVLASPSTVQWETQGSDDKRGYNAPDERAKAIGAR